ncbi:hypothetical protein TVAG_290200 [Trichomonas vaginalis G3]|uniref:Leucine Rich Repeat family protein n=1 Tax=Trichomonas vaginalis (strain ATCC PRA-98 / G3) TaxID=412133 RepID=A2F7P6_TRIV3|nr:ribonuclease inhibitor domain-containing protein [Trichomonas vaginalis G3]EAX99073.1 hypothetical protein TVAG_290200 [Trichomonas vaginalis G3]KAI5535009.1 ribonuclease inhibitor domain-containing protein [Trichomonas vaginalis G3]|eukprot:XP_001312003.1 hypothetical protein [Trichomonas vaginalis G3]
MSYTLPCIQVDQKKQLLMVNEVWSPLEEPIVCVPCDYKMVETKKSLRAGHVMITRGAVYFFKSKFMNPVVFDRKVHILDFRGMRVSTDNIIIEFDHFNGEISSKYAIQIYMAIMTVLKELTFGVSTYKPFEVHGDFALPQIVVSKRIPQAIRWRALFLAHFYDIRGNQLDTMTYFDKWENKKAKRLVLGPSFHPGNFGAAFGHAIGWETMIDTVCFQTLAPTQFARMILSILETASTIDRIAFSDYNNEDHLPQFPTNTIAATTINQWWILRSSFAMVRKFIEFSKFMQVPVKEFILATSKLTKENVTELSNLIDVTQSIQQLETFQLIRCQMKPFPFQPFMSMINKLQNLQNLIICGIDVNGAELLTALCKANATIRNLHITHMQFRNNLPDDLTLPEKLIGLSISTNIMSPGSFSTILSLILTKKRQYPLSLQMHNLQIKENAYKALESINPQSCLPNIFELDWSGNRMPVEESRYFFQLLATQTNLKLLRFEDMTPSDPVQFLRDTSTLTNLLHIPGLDLSGNWDTTLFTQYINSLSSMTWLRRLAIKNSNIGDNGATVLAGVLKQLTQLNDLCIDGMNLSGLDRTFQFWQGILDNIPNIVALDLPKKEISNAGLTPDDILETQMKIYDRIKREKLKPSISDQRLHFVINTIDRVANMEKNGEDASGLRDMFMTPEFFIHASKFMYSNKHAEEQAEAEGEEITE